MTASIRDFSFALRLACLPAACALCGCRTVAADGPPSAALAADGQAQLSVVIGATASERVQQAAKTLAAYLGRMSGATFKVEKGDGAAGLVVGQPGDFASSPFKLSFEPGPFNREEYVLRSAAGGLWLLGASELAVEHAVWDLLYRLGYRQFFPAAAWEVVPRRDKLAIAVDAREEPDFLARRIWYNWGRRDFNRQTYTDWSARNRAVKGFNLNSGHAYGGIIGANKAEFKAHPEYYALVKGERLQRGQAKLCISNPGLRQLVVDYAVRRFKKSPAMDSISMDPSDGGKWCECAPCGDMGSVSDRALTLANAVAAAINELGLGAKYVGMYAYNVHSPPPSIKAHPNVIISATTAFIRGNLTLDQIVEGWQAQGATLGIYDYYSVVAWDWNLPRRARSARPAGLAASIRKYHGQGARFLDAESGDAWGPYGLGFYVASRVMWDVAEADRVEALVDDFLTQAFAPAKAPMSQFYQLITVDKRRRSNADLTGRMYRHLAEARKLAAAVPAARARIDHLLLYTRYVELYNAFASATGDAKTAAKQQVLRHSWRIRRTGMVHTYGLWARLVGQKAAHQKDYPAKSEEPFAEPELAKILADGIAANTPVEVDFEPIEYSADLAPAAALHLPPVEPGSYPTHPQGRHTYLTWIDKAPAKIHLKVTVEHKWDLRPHSVTLFSPKEVTLEAVDRSEIVKPDGTTYDVILATPHQGLHRIEVRDGGDFTRIEWPAGKPVTLPSVMDTRNVKHHFRGAWSLYFYVPKGAKIVAGWASRIANWSPRISGTMRDGDGKVVYDFAKVEGGWFSVPVPKGQDGRLWKFQDSQGERLLVTVPPYMARTAADLLLPREVVEADAPAE